MGDQSDLTLAADAAKALGLAEVVPQAYVDVLQPMARELGSDLLLLARAVRIALAPVEGAVWSYEQIREWLAVRLAQKLRATPAERITTPPLHIAGPALLQLHFVTSEETLREMYANLLAAAMDSERVSEVHPSFVSVLEQLSPDEALLLRHISDKAEDDIIVEHTDEIGNPRGGTTWISQQWLALCRAVGVRQADSASTYLENLLRLRILDIEEGTQTRFEPDGHNRYGWYAASVDQDRWRTLRFTSFGERFLATCVNEPVGEADHVEGEQS